MRLVSLEIQNLRGIRQLSIVPDGKNIVFVGPNGAGKSAVVDSIDFLLTGQIFRLTGEGTAGISLQSHGKHVGCTDSKDALVRATILLPGETSPIQLERSVANPTVLDVQPAERKDDLSRLLALSSQRQHVLTRRDILAFIAVTPQNRADQIFRLMDLSEIENFRKALQSATNNLNQLRGFHWRTFQEAVSNLSVTTGIAKPTEKSLITFIDSQRKVLGGEPLNTVWEPNLRKDLLNPANQPKGKLSFNPGTSKRALEKVREVIASSLESDFAANDKELIRLLAEIGSRPDVFAEIRKTRFIEEGISFLDNTATCPLCDTDWADRDLLTHLTHKLELAKVADQYGKAIAGKSESLQTTVASVKGVLTRLNDEIEQLQDIVDAKQSLSDAIETLGQVEEILKIAQSKFEISPGTLEIVTGEVIGKGISFALAAIEAAIDAKTPKLTPEEAAWETLTKLEENMKVYKTQREDFFKAKSKHETAKAIEIHFAAARKDVLENIYESIRNDFVTLYKNLHGEEEKDFTASLEPTKAGAKFEVDFHGHGMSPPLALHSEGHQDSMGVCLFLALSTLLSRGILDLIVLDDIVMSVDIAHRTQLCEILKAQFSDRQLLITTHDQTWAKILKAKKVVSQNGIRELKNWTLAMGPSVNEHKDVWARIDADLDAGDVNAAAAKLRWVAEEFFYESCGKLHATIRFKIGGSWDLGDLMQAASGALNKHLGKAKTAGQSWGNKANQDASSDIETRLAKAYQEAQGEQWAVNPAVHYTHWLTLSPAEFRNVVKAFKELFEVFECADRENCGSMLKVTVENMRPSMLACDCGQVALPLIPKAAGA